MLTKLFARVENYMFAVTFIVFIYLATFWRDGIQNLNYWENYTGVPSNIALYVLGALILISFLLCKVLRHRGTLQAGFLNGYVIATITVTIGVLIVCLESPFIAPQWQNSILPPPVFDNWNVHMQLMSYLYLALFVMHFSYTVYALFRILLVPAVERMVFAEA